MIVDYFKNFVAIGSGAVEKVFLTAKHAKVCAEVRKDKTLTI